MLFSCSTCKYVFPSTVLPERCPDCGMLHPGRASLSEISWYEAIQKEKRDYQRMFTHPHRISAGYTFA